MKFNGKLLLPEISMAILQIQEKKLLKETENLMTFTSNGAIGFLHKKTMIKTYQRKDQQIQFPIYLRKFQLIVETHLPMQLILCEIKDRLYACTTENYLKSLILFTVPGNSDYASIIKNGRKALVVGDSHVKRIQRNDFNKEIKNGKAIF